MTNTIAAVLSGDRAGLPEPVSDTAVPVGAPVFTIGCKHCVDYVGKCPYCGCLRPPPSGAADCFEFQVPGQPVGWARAGGGKTMHRFTPAAQRNYSVAVKLFCQAAMAGAAPLDGPIAVEIHAVYPWPASWSQRKRIAPGNRWKVSKPDYDNIAKLVGDALNTIAWTDDARICKALAYKYYGDLPCLKVRVRKL